MANFSPTVRHRRLLQELRQLRGAAASNKKKWLIIWTGRRPG
ncbi:hypothetical protein ACFQX6_55600 [Streptosporangium lutulentum]